MASPFTYANIVAQCPSGWTYSSTITDSNQTIYINGCSWVIQARVSSVLLRSNWVEITAYYYNGSTWVQAYAPRGNNGHTVYKSGKGDQSLKFYHNRSAEGTTSGDQPLYQMWKIEVKMRGKDGSAHGYFDWYVGGIEKMTNAEYNSYFRYKPIKYVPVYVTNSSNDTTFPTLYRPSSHRGAALGTQANVGLAIINTIKSCGYSAFD